MWRVGLTEARAGGVKKSRQSFSQWMQSTLSKTAGSESGRARFLDIWPRLAGQRAGRFC